VGSLYLSNVTSTKRNDLYAIAIVNKKTVNRTVSLENELVPLNGRIVWFRASTRQLFSGR